MITDAIVAYLRSPGCTDLRSLGCTEREIALVILRLICEPADD
jgi:hypothetical protein